MCTWRSEDSSQELSSPATMSVLRNEIGSLSLGKALLSAKHLTSPNGPFGKNRAG